MTAYLTTELICLRYSIIELLSRESSANQASAPIAYFYCVRNATEPKRANPDEIMRSILKQLSCMKSDLPIREPVPKVYMEKKEVADDSGCEIESLDITECVQHILAVLEKTSATIIIDALDECDSNRRHQLLMALDDIIQHSTSLVKVFISSRDDKDIVSRLEHSPNVFINASDNIEDIKHFVRLEVERSIEDRKLLSGEVSEDLKHLMMSTLIDQADGMYVTMVCRPNSVDISSRFRWVSLQIENLCDNERIKHEMDIRTELGRLPKTLKASYDVTFRRIENSAPTSRRIAQNAMKWLICAQRPLDATEFIAAVSMDSTGNSVSLSVSEILHMCCNMVMLDVGLNVFRLVHLSLREYLEAREDYAMIETHRLATERCINAFIYTLIPSMPSLDLFSRYAALNWPTHYRCLIDAKKDMLKTMAAFFFNGQDPSSPFAYCISVTANVYESLPWTDSYKIVLREILSVPPSPLFLGSCLGLSSVLELLSMNEAVDWNQYNSNGNTALHISITFEQESIVQYLLGKNVNLELADKDARTALSLAAALGRESIVRMLLENGASVVARDWHDRTPLHAAIIRRHKAIAELLLMQGVNIEERDKDGKTALQMAVSDKNEEVVCLLIKFGASIEHVARNKYWILRSAASDSSKGMTLIEHFLEVGYEVKGKSVDGNALLHQAIERGNIALVELFLEERVLNDSEIQRMLRTASTIGNAGAVQVLLHHGVNIEARGREGKTALRCAVEGKTSFRCAVEGNHELVIQLLLLNGADLEARDESEQTPLHFVAQKGLNDTLRDLLQKGANIEARDKWGLTPLCIAASKGQDGITRILLENGADIQARTHDGQTALYYAVLNDRETITRILLENGADIEAKDNMQDTPLHKAAYEGHKSIVQTLMYYGADIEAKNEFEQTPLHLAVHSGYDVIVLKLLDSGADVESRDSFGYTPLHEAAFHCFTETTPRILCERGANIKAKDIDGRTPLYLTLKSENQEMVRLLREKGAVEYKLDPEDVLN